MVKNKRVAKSPLLYIDQPTIATPIAPMQADYQSTNKKDTPPPIQKNEQRTIRSRPRRHKNRQETNVLNEKDSNQSIGAEAVNEKVDLDDSRPKFKDMSLHEKIEYFANVPAHIPKMKCEIKAKDKSYRGVILEFDGETVLLRVGKRPQPTSIPYNDIKEVRMLGF